MIKQNSAHSVEFQLIDRKKNEVARWSDEKYQCLIYHDSSGSSQLKFEVYYKRTNQLTKVVLGEVKYTRCNNYAIKRLEELLEYMKIGQIKAQNYLTEDDTIKVKGLLFLDQLKLNKKEFSDVK
ncbi:hypothetical protein GCM10010954_28200 [Halobacillus andaensis]|uniref:Uncharacterized protein n=1 Tax=Halobacillus andaensis TaxID=1176239 RepID=A0A917B6H2_HALAA|nr:hypothetical protein [Halobacillus andaensis]MBP2006451.1 hypothetical protein [Halobacillus andaensis]GGF27485.1 hypothetical protein GCM10010954_28200 [Halobacillus andaensis]